MQLHHDILFWNPPQSRYHNHFYHTQKKEAETAFKIMTKCTSQHAPAEADVQNTYQKNHTLPNFSLEQHILSPETDLNVTA